jgi:hypothetical protein
MAAELTWGRRGPRAARSTRLLLALALAASLGLGLGACASADAAALARQACEKVDRSLALYARSEGAGGAQAAALRARALALLRAALPIAAVAAGEDSSWQALEATLSETNRVPEGNLLQALSAQCPGSAALPAERSPSPAAGSDEPVGLAAGMPRARPPRA